MEKTPSWDTFMCLSPIKIKYTSRAHILGYHVAIGVPCMQTKEILVWDF